MDGRFDLRIDSDTLEKYRNNLPDGVANLSDLFRLGAQALFEGRLIEADGKSDIEEFLNALEDTKEELMDEIIKNRSAINKLSRIEQNQHEANSTMYKKAKIKELKRIWLRDPDVERPQDLNQIETAIPEEYDFLRSCAIDTIEKLSDEGYLTISTNGKIKWNENLL